MTLSRCAHRSVTSEFGVYFSRVRQRCALLTTRLNCTSETDLCGFLLDGRNLAKFMLPEKELRINYMAESGLLTEDKVLRPGRSNFESTGDEFWEGWTLAN